MNLALKLTVLITFIVILCLDFIPAMANREPTKVELVDILDRSIKAQGLQKREDVIYVINPKTRMITIKEAIK